MSLLPIRHAQHRRRCPVQPSISTAHQAAATLRRGADRETFGQHDGLLVTSVNGRVLRSPRLVVPGDSGGGRTIGKITAITIAVHPPQIAVPRKPGGIVVNGSRQVTITRAQLEALPQVSNQGLPWTERTFSGPTLASVLAKARVKTNARTYVLGMAASDAHVAAVTPGEAIWGNRRLMVVLNQDGQAVDLPRLGVIGDARGARYVTGLTTLVIGRG